VPQASDICGECPACSHCNYGLKDCEKNVHEAAKVLYGGGDTNMNMFRLNLAKDIFFNAKNNYSVGYSFEIADEFISRSKRDTDE
jgi:hypothetical protein